MKPSFNICRWVLLFSFFWWAPTAWGTSLKAQWDEQAQLIQHRFGKEVRPVLNEFCFRCHDEQKKKGGVQLDVLSGGLESSGLFQLREILDQLKEGVMPPEDEAQPDSKDRELVVSWLEDALELAQRRPLVKNGSARRLTVAQYQNTLGDLLGIREDIITTLPPDSVSKDGFLNNSRTMLLTPDFLENYLEVAEDALDLTLVDASAKPLLQRFKVEFGQSINTNPGPDKLVLNGGHILPNADLILTEPLPDKGFEFDFFRMPPKLRFIEGYTGNPTVRGWRTFSGIYHSLFGVQIGSGGSTSSNGFVLKAAGRAYKSGKPIAWGPTPALNVVTRRLPKAGQFRITVEAARQPMPNAEQGQSPNLGVYLGLRRDCGLTVRRVGAPLPVSSEELQRYVYEGSMGDYPDPDVELGNVNYLAGLREISLRNEYIDGRGLPELRVRSLEFEGPIYDTWPPKRHRDIFFAEGRKEDVSYARDILERFASKAYRRSVTPQELSSLVSVWENSFNETEDFVSSIKDVLLVILTSPQFLFLIEESQSPAPEPLTQSELASKLSYFLWNGPPDGELLRRAGQGMLTQQLELEVDRMMADKRFDRFVQAFAFQWLSLDKFDVVEVDRGRFGKLTPHVRRELRKEPIELLKYMIRQNRPVKEWVQADYIVANDVVADYYGLGGKSGAGFQFARVSVGDKNLGGILAQAAILAGLSDGREPNPVKRGAWIARKLIADPPDDPPPNVPELSEEGAKNLSLREKLERHRNQKGCKECHAGIDPWGIPLEEYDAGGRFKRSNGMDTRSVLPDGMEVADANGLKALLATERIDQVAFSVMKHLAVYATGRSLGYHEVEYFRNEGRQLRSDGYRMADMIRFVINSPAFLEK